MDRNITAGSHGDDDGSRCFFQPRGRDGSWIEAEAAEWMGSGWLTLGTVEEEKC